MHESLVEMSLDARNAYYASHGYSQTCPDSVARTMPRVKWLMEEAKAERFSTWLDLACHDGFTSRWMVDEPDFQILVGVDPCIDAIRAAQRSILTRANHQKATYFCMPYNQISEFWACSFSGVSAFEFIEHLTIDEVKELLEWMHRQLEFGGRAYLCTPNKHGKWGDTNPDKHHITLFDKQSLHDLVKEVVGKEPEWHDYEEKCEHLMCKWRK